MPNLSRTRLTGTGTVTYGEEATTMTDVSAARLIEAMARTEGPGPLRVVVYDRVGMERFRSPCSPAVEGRVARFTSRDTPGLDIDDPSLCVVLDERGTELAWFRIDPPARFAAGRPVVLQMSLR
jgi:hypothetical protein